MPRKADEILHFRQTQNNPKACPVEGGAVKPLVLGAVLRDSRGIKHLYVDYTVHIYVVCVCIYILVGGAITILENMKVSRKDDIPYIMENKKCSKPPTSIYVVCVIIYILQYMYVICILCHVYLYNIYINISLSYAYIYISVESMFAQTQDSNLYSLSILGIG